MYWIISIFSILCIFSILLYYLYDKQTKRKERERAKEKMQEGFSDTRRVASIANLVPDPEPLSAEANAFNSNAFHTKYQYYIASGSNATDTLLADIQFCKTAAASNSPFSDSRFARTCGICMTQGTILLDKTPFSQSTQRRGTGVVVYQPDKDFSLRESSQAIPSAHSAYCENLFIGKSLPPNVSVANLTGLAINAQQYEDTMKYLESVNILSFANTTSCSPSLHQPITCSNANTTISSMRLIYGHFNDGCESGSNLIRTEVFPTDCLKQESCTYTTNLPAGQRQWYINAECKIQEESIPQGLLSMKRRGVSGLSTSLSNVAYYWADPFTSVSKDINTFTLYSTCTVQKDTQIQIEYCTSASFDLYLHTLKQYTQPSPGKKFIYHSNSPVFALYKGDNTIRLNVTSTNETRNGMYFRIKTVDGTPLTTLDSTWVYSSSNRLDTPSPRIGQFPVRAEPLWSNASIKASIIAPKNSTTKKINYYKQVTLTSEKLLTLGTCIFDSSITKPLDNSFTYSTYVSFNGIEKQITLSKDNTDRVQAYSEYFPAGTTTLRVSVEGNGNTCFIALLGDSNKNVIAVSDASWTSDELPSVPVVVPVPPKPTYVVQDFVTYTSAGTDLPNQPMTGTVKECQDTCSAEPSCLGFSRLKGGNPARSEYCFLKKNMISKTANQRYETYVKKEK
jgi:hypothetical protein